MSNPECPSCGEKHCEGQPVCGLKYIARSPKHEHGGFHPEAIKTAKAALRLIYQLRRRCAHQDKYFADVALQLIDAHEKLAELGAVREVVSA
jgi:hypothetical protein